MKHSTLVAILLFLAAAVGALTAAWLYIRRREKELDEYEQLLFSDEFEEEDEPVSAEEAAPAPDYVVEADTEAEDEE